MQKKINIISPFGPKLAKIKLSKNNNTKARIMWNGSIFKINELSLNSARYNPIFISHEPGYTTNHIWIISPIEWCLVEIAINILFWLTCHALLKDFSRNKDAIGENITGGRFS